ncbi:MAG TPA: hypothetical protein PLV42_01975 [bacterium]|nr:hypothetical protein [bacterium]
MRYLAPIFVLIFVVVACKKDDNAFFTKGKKVESGLIWEKSPVTADSILAGKKVTPLFSDTFDRPDLGPNWQVQGGDWRLEEGVVQSMKANNLNLVLTGTALPDNAVIELTMWSESDFVDIKFNAWGDGKPHEHGDGYSFILGGWKNRVSVIAKLHEHEKNRVEDRATRLEQSKRYQVKIIRIGGKIWWFVDDAIFLAYNDPQPLTAAGGYKYLSFANWESMAYFDGLKISTIE